MLIGAAIDMFYNNIANERRMSPQTVRSYMTALDDFENFLREDHVTDVEEISATHVRQWLMVHMEVGGKASSARTRKSALSSWLKYLLNEGVITKDIMAKITPPKMPQRKPVFYRESETEHLYDEGVFEDDFDSKCDRLILRILYETGMRRTELAGIKESDIDFSAHTIKVLGKRDKQRIIPIEEELMASIKEYIDMKHEEVGLTEELFVTKRGRVVTDGMVYHKVRKYMLRLSNADRVSPHIFRHSFATHLLNEGADIQAIKEILGHAKLDSTEVYTHTTREYLKDEYSNTHPRSNKTHKQ